MDFQLDIPTLLYLFIFGNLFIALLITFYRYHFTKDIASGTFIAAKWLQVAYWCSMLLWDVLPRWIAIPFSNGLVLISYGLEIAALLLMMGMLGRKDKLYFLCIAAGSILCYLIVAVFFNQPNFRVATASFWAMLFVIYPAFRLTRRREGSPLQKLLGTVFYLIAAAMLGRAVAALFLEPDMAALSPDTAQYPYLIGMFFMMVMGTAAFVLLSNEHSYERLKRMATYDTLTAILSRRAFFMEAEVKLALAVQKGEPYTLLLMDIDHFKNVNDTYGHDQGDKVLQGFALTVEAILGNGDLFGRVGGEEFAVMLYGLDEEASTLKAEQLREAVVAASQINPPCEYTVSIGIITVMPDQWTSLSMLYKLCDRALYQAKQNGRNRVVRSA
ncbi:GGDEF domain-containing protein ['Paenibacillus yunnanensis' Narsing Rao et al. 2020]|uniref:GGDEF domain-containing protein n=1 Tax=Paenibacillus tengchongensis TaxID=2608684 RepID=UPI00124D7573|nr:GGDEF domain-containing protein [Paenibacillus tengchongensis]